MAEDLVIGHPLILGIPLDVASVVERIVVTRRVDFVGRLFYVTLVKPPRFHEENLAKHGVLTSEAEEALHDGWGRRRKVGDCYEVLGRTAEGRYLQLAVEVVPEEIRVFHGREMDETERRRYARK